MVSIKNRLRTIIVLCAAAVASTVPFAQTITIGLASDITAFDPHYHNVGPNNSATAHVFERLVQMDERQRLTPGLALSWKPIDDLNWEFKLRKGVRWHDGSDFTADDVIFFTGTRTESAEFAVIVFNLCAADQDDQGG